MQGRLIFAALAIALFIAPAYAQEKEDTGKTKEEKPSDLERGLMLFKSAVKTYEATRPVGPEEEKTMGRAIAREVFLRYGPRVDDETLNSYITKVGKVAASPVTGVDFRFAVIENDQANAFAAPGGYIFITTGLLEKLESEAQLAGVLAHEAAHVTKKHMIDAIQRARKLSGVAELSATLLQEDPKEFNKVVAMATDILFTRGLDKDKEYEADSVGTKYAAAAGYDAAGLSQFLQKLKAAEGSEPSIFFTTHPPTGERIARLEKGVIPEMKPGAVLSERFSKNVRE